MLVLARRIGEEIVIGDNIRVTVLNIQGQIIKLGITAPPSIHVVREELLAASWERARCPLSHRPNL